MVGVTVHGPEDLRPDDLRPVDISDDGLPVLPDQTRDESDIGWGEPPEADDLARFLDERPPHWD